MKKLLRHAEEYLAGLFLAAVTLLIVVQLVLDFVAPRLSSPLTKLVLALFFWTTMLAVPAATRRGAHLSLMLLSRGLPPRWRRALQAAILLAALAFFIAVAVTGARLCWDQAKGHNRSFGPWCPDWVVTTIVPLAATLSCVRAVEAWRRQRRGRGGDDGEPAPQATPSGEG